jgi:hypothetical protein
VDAARDEAERRVAEAVRDERARLEQKAREVRLASAAERRRRAGDSGTVGATTNTKKKTHPTPSDADAPNDAPSRSAWGVPRTTPSSRVFSLQKPSSLAARSSRDFVAENEKKSATKSARTLNTSRGDGDEVSLSLGVAPFDVAGFLDAGEAAAAEEKKTFLKAAASPADAGYKTRAKASAAAAAEAEAWAAARASAAAEVAAEVTRARRTIRRNAPVLVESSASGTSDAEGESLATRAAASDEKDFSLKKKRGDDDDDAGSKARFVFEAHRARSPARVRKADEDTADEGRRRAEARVRAFQRRETERLARSRRSAGRTGDVEDFERSAERPPPRFTAAERRAAAAEASTAEKLRLARAALADAEVDGVRLEEALRRAADADRFEEELAGARRRAAEATLTSK